LHPEAEVSQRPRWEKEILMGPHCPIAVQLTNLSRRMAGKVDTEKGRKIYPRRIAIAEPVFANIRTHKRLDRFTLRGKIKVNIQWMLYCMVHNIGKIANYAFT
jgi:IS5 family transposase